MTDQTPTDNTRYADPLGRSAGSESSVRRMYEFAPYPDLGADLKDPAPIFAPVAGDLAQRKKLRYLEAGCGTGHFLVGVAKAHPDWQCYGIDLSDASLQIARALSERHKAPVHVARGSYLEPLPFGNEPFDVISAMGTIHHAEDPVAALTNLRGYLKDDGWFAMHVYGRRLDSEKFDIKEMLSILQPDLFAHGERFALYQQLMRHRRSSGRLRRWLDTSPLDLVRQARSLFSRLARRAKKESWSPSWTENYDVISAAWIDHFCHPCERAYEVPELKQLIERAGFRVVHMLGQGREERARLPAEWREAYARLPDWDRWRLMELLSPPRSFLLLMQPVRRL